MTTTNHNQIIAAHSATKSVVNAGTASQNTTTSNVLKAKMSRSDRKIGLDPAASLEISETGRQLATHIPVRITTQAEAKTQVAELSQQLKKEPDIAKNVHSNLRMLRINHLIYN